MPITGKTTYSVDHRIGNRWGAYEAMEGASNSSVLVGILIDVKGDRSEWMIEGDPRKKVYASAMAACGGAAEYRWQRILGNTTPD